LLLALFINKGVTGSKAQDPNSPMELVMYAVVKTGGKQYKVVVGQKLKVEQITADIDSQIVLNEVLMVADGEAVVIGAPLVAGASISATVVTHGRGDKVTIFKMRRRKHYQRHQGHRQNYTELRIDAIVK
jgi:large subunit ribosomal protein L21